MCYLSSDLPFLSCACASSNFFLSDSSFFFKERQNAMLLSQQQEWRRVERLAWIEEIDDDE
jgi:hypothetical protein